MSRHRLRPPLAGLGQVKSGTSAAMTTSSALDPATRAMLQSKLNDALNEYRLMSTDIYRLVAGIPFNVTKFDQAVSIARRGRSGGVVQMTREQLAALIVGTFAKIEDVLRNNAAMVATARDRRVAGIVDQSISAARRAMARMAQLRDAIRSASGTAGLGQTGTDVAQIAIVVGVLLSLTGAGGLVGILLIGGGAAYLLAESNDELDAAEREVGQYLRDFEAFCANRPDRAACIAEYQQVVSSATASQQALIQANAEARALIERTRMEGTLGWLLRPLGEAAPYLIAGGGVVVLGLVLYFTWPLLAGFRRGTKAIVGNRRRNRRRRKSRKA